MFTRNWYRLFTCVAGYVDVPAVNMDGTETNINYKNGVLLQIGLPAAGYNPSLHNVQTSLGTNAGVIFGTGTVPPTIDDYKLSGKMITGGFVSTSAVTVTPDDDGFTATSIYTITNSGTEEITIGEIALMGSARQNAVAQYKLLLERTILEAPVTIPAGGVGQITYTIRMNYPTA